jgi:hypothetical protein
MRTQLFVTADTGLQHDEEYDTNVTLDHALGDLGDVLYLPIDLCRADAYTAGI